MYAKYIFYSYDNGTLLLYFIKSSICFSGAAFFYCAGLSRVTLAPFAFTKQTHFLCFRQLTNYLWNAQQIQVPIFNWVDRGLLKQSLLLNSTFIEHTV